MAMKMCKYVFIVVVLATFTSCLNRTGRKDLVTNEKIECTDSIRMLNLITEALKIDHNFFTGRILEDDGSLPNSIIISRRNLPYKFTDSKPDSLFPTLRFLPDDTLKNRNIDEYVLFEEINIDCDTAFVSFLYAPEHTRQVIANYIVEDCEVILIDFDAILINRLDFVNPDRLD